MKTEMRRYWTLLLGAALIIAVYATGSRENIAPCPVTLPGDSDFVPPQPYPEESPFESLFWYGSDGLWTMLPIDGIWDGLPWDGHGYTQKIFWWADGYDWIEEPKPVFLLSGERLDGKAPMINTSEATNAYTEATGSSILTGLNIPTPGCWQLTGSYRGQELSFVVLVRP